MELLTATQAAEIAKKKEPEINAAREASVEETLQQVMKRIVDAAERGDRQIVFDFTNTKHFQIVSDRLRKMGYSIANHYSLNIAMAKNNAGMFGGSARDIIEKEISW